MNSAQKQLLGVWRSDKRKTLQTLHRYHCLSDGKKKRTIGGLFGKLQVRYTGKYVYGKLRDYKYRERYDVVAENENSIVVRVYRDSFKKRMGKGWVKSVPELFEPDLYHFNFEQQRGRQYYWIGQGKFCEWFQKQQQS